MNHSDIQSSMADHLEGDLSLEKRALFDAHLDACVDCARELSEMRATIGLLRRLPRPEPPSDLADNVMRRIAGGEGQPGWLDRAACWLSDLNDWASEPRFAVPFTVLAASLAVFLVTTDAGVTATSARTDASFAQEHRRTQVARSSEIAQRRTRVGNHVEVRKPANVPARVWAERVANNSIAAPEESLGMRGSNPGDDALPLRSSVRRSTARRHRLELANAEISGRANTQPLRTRDEWLDVLIEQPELFAREHRELSSIEQELWITHLSRGAVEGGRLDEVVAALRATSDPVALALANSFSTDALRR